MIFHAHPLEPSHSPALTNPRAKAIPHRLLPEKSLNIRVYQHDPSDNTYMRTGLGNAPPSASPLTAVFLR